jgi:RimJ/RimL family protein N-acetyltransferase
MDVEIIPCSIEQMQKLIEGADAFQSVYKLQVVDGYMPFAGALQYILNQMQTSQVEHPWLPYLFVFRPDRAVVGLGGFKTAPDAARRVEIGYSVAPSYQGRGFATSAARQLIEIAFASELVDCVCAHTLAEPNASTKVLTNCGMSKVSDAIDPEVGKLWRWEIGKSGEVNQMPENVRSA